MSVERAIAQYEDEAQEAWEMLPLAPESISLAHKAIERVFNGSSSQLDYAIARDALDKLVQQAHMSLCIDNEVLAHISWLRLYVREMSESNWRDMQLYMERQIERLAENLARRAA